MRTEIATLGEFGLIRHLTEGIELKNESSRYGVGDDAAVLSYPAEKEVLVTTDLLMEGVHFDLVYVPLKHLGYKSAVVNFSDIYAMNGTPKQITVSLGISKRFSIEDMEELYAGIRLACEEYDVDIVGGDTSASYTGLTISITCIGEGEKGKVVYRNGARETDLICVSGDLGAAYMGLQLLEREKAVLKGGDKDLQPDFSGKEYLLERQLKPEARRDIIQKLAEESSGKGKFYRTSQRDLVSSQSSEARSLRRILEQPTIIRNHRNRYTTHLHDGYIGRSFFGITAYLYPKQSGLPSLRRTYSYRLSDGCNGRRIQYEPEHLCTERRRGL